MSMEIGEMTILIVDDEKSILDVMRSYLSTRGYSTLTATSGEEAADILDEKTVDLVLTDIKMPGISGVDLLKIVKEKDASIPVIITTGFPTIDTAIEALKLGAYDYLTKPFHLEEIAEKIKRALQTKKLEAENALFSKLVSLHEVTKVLSSTHDSRHLNDMFINYAMKISHSSAGALFYYDDKSNLEISLASEPPENSDLTFWEDEFFYLAAKLTSENDIPIVADSVSADLPEELKKLPEGISAFVAVPLKSVQKALGVVVLVKSEGKDAYSDVDLEMITVLTAQASVAVENANLYKNIQDSFFKTISGFAMAVEAKDTYTHGHSENVMKYTLVTAKSLGLSESDITLFKHAGLLHDIGKIGVQEAVLNKPGKLTDEEFEHIKQHPELGARILSDMPNFEDIVPLVRHHHEFINGKGYPDGLKGDEIPYGARILAVADAFEAMTSNRPYRKAMPFEKAFGILEANKGTQFDADITDVFIDVMKDWQKKYGEGSSPDESVLVNDFQ